MSRMIDADDFKDYIVYGFEQNKDLFDDKHRDLAKVITCGFLKDIDEQPTVYDIDKVIEQLEELEKEHPYKVIGQPDTYSQYNEAWRDCMDRVLGIVKRGGVE